MKTWEYQIAEHRGPIDRIPTTAEYNLHLQGWFNSWGSQGWELVKFDTVPLNPIITVAVFKKQRS